LPALFIARSSTVSRHPYGSVDVERLKDEQLMKDRPALSDLSAANQGGPIMSIALNTIVPGGTVAAYHPLPILPPSILEAQTPAPLNTAQDLLDWVRRGALRHENQRRNMGAAIRWLGKVDGTPLAAIPLDVRCLVDNRIRRIRRHKPLT